MLKKIIPISVVLLLAFGSFVFIKKKQLETPISFQFPPESITTALVENQEWESVISVPATIKTVKGVLVSSEISGIITKIHFKSGMDVLKGAPLIDLNTSSEIAELESALARAELSKINLSRAKKLLSSKTIARSEFDTKLAESKAAEAEVKALQALIDKKQICAPFSGKLGIRSVHLGEYLKPGSTIVSLQNLEKVYVHFTTSQKNLSTLKVGQKIRVFSDAWTNQIFTGNLSVIEPRIKIATRSLQILGTIPNPEGKLKPNMFVKAEVIQGIRNVIAIPATAIYHRSYGSIVFVLKPNPQNPEGLIVEERFVSLGKSKGDYIEISEGLKQGEEVAATGVFKLSNNRAVSIDNQKALDYKTVSKFKDQ